MKLIKESILLATLSLISLAIFMLPTSQATAATSASPAAIESQDSLMAKHIASTTHGLSPNVVQLALNGYHWALKQGEVTQKNYLTIVNFSLPSKQKRLWIINLNRQQVVLNTFVANGKNSGLYKGTRFSNTPRSLESSLGIYVTGTTYYGHDGLSMHVHGLQAGVNSNAYRRLLEFHGANYVSPAFAKKYGRVGRSWGCFALDKALLPTVVKTIKGGSVVFAYAKDHPQDFQPYAIA